MLVFTVLEAIELDEFPNVHMLSTNRNRNEEFDTKLKHGEVGSIEIDKFSALLNMSKYLLILETYYDRWMRENMSRSAYDCHHPFRRIYLIHTAH